MPGVSSPERRQIDGAHGVQPRGLPFLFTVRRVPMVAAHALNGASRFSHP